MRIRLKCSDGRVAELDPDYVAFVNAFWRMIPSSQRPSRKYIRTSLLDRLKAIVLLDNQEPSTTTPQEQKE